MFLNNLSPIITSKIDDFQKINGLILVSTPIGNLLDITIRALKILETADYIVCEDTRVSKKLLTAYGIRTSLMVYNDHSATHQRDKIIGLLKDGLSIALITDAGTPLISDPGYKLIQQARLLDIPITAAPGPVAAVNALVLSTLPPDRFTFYGFVPQKQKARGSLYDIILKSKTTSILYESSHNLLKTLEELKEFGDRKISVVKEMTKLFESVVEASAMDILDACKNLPIKGEFVIIIGPKNQDSYTDDEIITMIQSCLENHSVNETAKIVAKITNETKNKVYDKVLFVKEMKDES